MKTVESEARKALNRFRRAIEKAETELRSLEGALRHAEQTDFPVESYEDAEASLRVMVNFADEEGERLREKILCRWPRTRSSEKRSMYLVTARLLSWPSSSDEDTRYRT